MSNLMASQALLPVAVVGVAGFGALLWAACFSVSALGAVGVKGPFSPRRAMSGETVGKKAIQGLSMATEKAVCENMCSSCASALRNREAVTGKAVPKTPRGQRLLGAGLALTAMASIVTIMAAITSAA